MRSATFGLILAIAAWLAATLAANMAERSYDLLGPIGQRSLYVDQSAATALNWTSQDRQSFSCLFTQARGTHFCGLNFQINDGAKRGVDFRNYSKIRMAVEYTGPAERFRVYYRNSFMDMAMVEAKYHQFILPIRKGAYVYEIPFSNLEVPEWWVSQVKVSAPDLRIAQRDSVVHAGFDIETPMPIGQHHFELMEFSVVGPWLSANNAIWWAVGSGVYLLLVGMIYNFFRLRSQLKERSEEMFGLLRKLERVDTESAHFKKLSMYDPLTGLLNRRAALELVDSFAQHNSLLGTALLVMDIDHFKRVNDTFGHDLGDEVLKLVSAGVRQSLREGDAAVRWGGEEIVVICPKTSPEGAIRVAEKLREEIKQLRFSHPDLKITASFGVANIRPGESFDETFRRADEALYSAKNSGRDRVCSAAGVQ